MKNLRIVPEKRYSDGFGTGDHISYEVFNIVRDFTDDELKRFNYTEGVIKKGIVLETLRSEEFAQVLLDAMKEKYAGEKKETPVVATVLCSVDSDNKEVWKDEFTDEVKAQELFDSVTKECSEHTGTYRIDLVFHHKHLGNLIRRTMYKNVI